MSATFFSVRTQTAYPPVVRRQPINGGASFRWLFGLLSAWGSIESTTILTTHPSLPFNLISFQPLYHPNPNLVPTSNPPLSLFYPKSFFILALISPQPCFHPETICFGWSKTSPRPGQSEKTKTAQTDSTIDHDLDRSIRRDWSQHKLCDF